MLSHQKLLADIRRTLDAISRTERSPAGSYESGWAQLKPKIRLLPRDGLLEKIDEAVGGSPDRRRSALLLMAELGDDLPGLKERALSELRNPDAEIRRIVIGMIEDFAWKDLAVCLNGIMLHDESADCRREAMRVAGVLRQDVNLSVILELAKSRVADMTFVLKDFACEETRALLRREFDSPTVPTSCSVHDIAAQDARAVAQDRKIVAAWGLAKLGDREAIAYLGRMLYDPDERGTNYFRPGGSLRAAQALADVYGLAQGDSSVDVMRVRNWWERYGAHRTGNTAL